MLPPDPIPFIFCLQNRVEVQPSSFQGQRNFKGMSKECQRKGKGKGKVSPRIGYVKSDETSS